MNEHLFGFLKTNKINKLSLSNAVRWSKYVLMASSNYMRIQKQIDNNESVQEAFKSKLSFALPQVTQFERIFLTFLCSTWSWIFSNFLKLSSAYEISIQINLKMLIRLKQFWTIHWFYKKNIRNRIVAKSLVITIFVINSWYLYVFIINVLVI